MAELHNLFGSLREFSYGGGKTGKLYSLPALDEMGIAGVSRLPVSLRIVLESVLRNYDDKRITETDVCNLARWKPNPEQPGAAATVGCPQVGQEQVAVRTEEIPFVV